MMRGRSSIPWLLALALAASCDSPNRPSVVETGDPESIGAAVVARSGCPKCHDPGDGTLSGQATPQPMTMTYGGNLTPDPETGLGGWTGDQIVRALRLGVDAQGRTLCPTMPRFLQMNDREANAVVTFLRGLAPVPRPDVPPSLCPMPSAGDAAAAGDDAGVPEDAAIDDDASPPTDDLERPNPSWRPDAGVPRDAILGADLGTRTDAASAERDAGASPSSDDGGAACRVTINEVQTAGSGGAEDEFIELYNACAGPASLEGIRLVYRSAAGTVDKTLLALAGTTLAAGGYLVLGGLRFSLKADLTYHGSLADSGGLALRDGDGKLLDTVGWGSATNAYVAGRAAPGPDPASSIQRLPDGRDSGDNSRDFVATTTPTPGAPNR